MTRGVPSALLVAGAGLLALAGLRTARADDSRAEDHAFLDVLSSKASVCVGEPFVVRIRIGVDEPWFSAHAVALFRQPTDLPLHVTAPWLPVPPSTRALPDMVAASLSPPSTHSSLALGDEAVSASRQAPEDRRGRIFTVWQVERRLLPEKTGDLVLDGGRLSFAYATSFEEDALGTRRPADRRDATVPGQTLRVHVTAQPEDGRPAGFSGPVGSYVASASIDKPKVSVGESLRITWRIEGEGSLETMGTPRIEGTAGGLPGFHVFGTLDDKGTPRRTIVIEASPLSADVHAVPSLSLAYFDPGPPAQYRTATTAPIALEVLGKPGALAPPAPKAPEREDAAPASALPWVLLALGAILLVLLLLRRRRAARGTVIAPSSASRRVRAIEAYRAATSRASEGMGSDAIASQVDSLTAYLGVLLHCSPSGVASPNLEVRLASVGVPVDLASRIVHALSGWEAARYGGQAPRGPTADALVGELDELKELEESGTPRDEAPRE